MAKERIQLDGEGCGIKEGESTSVSMAITTESADATCQKLLAIIDSEKDKEGRKVALVEGDLRRARDKAVKRDCSQAMQSLPWPP